LDASGNRYIFRGANERAAGEYELFFGGVVLGYRLPTEDIQGEVLSRVMQDGSYTWVVEAVAADGSQDRQTGTLLIQDADVQLPDLRGFSISPTAFTPNRDGVDDRTFINLALTKDAKLTVTLIEAGSGLQRVIPEKPGKAAPDSVGLHTFEYEGDVDLDVEPPPDGTHQVVALAQDRVGQQVRVQGELTIANGGVPRAEIVNATVTYNTSTVLQGGVLEFELVVENYGVAPLRTTDPAPGYLYHDTETANTFGFYEQSGAWRVGIDCDVCIRDYPWRWALGDRSDLTKIGDFYYLMPGKRAVITGKIQLDTIPDRNPLYFWAGLIHEDVEVSSVNNRVDPQLIKIVPFNEQNEYEQP
jgi:hypothetical protein